MAIDSIDDYIASQPAEMQEILKEVRRRVHEAVPGAGEMISYGIPTITVEGHYVVYFAGWKHHLSVYPVPRGEEDLRAEMDPYLTGKGTLKFPLGKPIPYDMIANVAAQLAAERQRRK
ncbi:iron chaperone [Arthrobacter sp. SA17]